MLLNIEPRHSSAKFSKPLSFNYIERSCHTKLEPGTSLADVWLYVQILVYVKQWQPDNKSPPWLVAPHYTVVTCRCVNTQLTVRLLTIDRLSGQCQYCEMMRCVYVCHSNQGQTFMLDFCYQRYSAKLSRPWHRDYWQIVDSRCHSTKVFDIL